MKLSLGIVIDYGNTYTLIENIVIFLKCIKNIRKLLPGVKL